jgi:hypothetical protein
VTASSVSSEAYAFSENTEAFDPIDKTAANTIASNLVLLILISMMRPSSTTDLWGNLFDAPISNNRPLG